MIVFLASFVIQLADAQYFGRNKPSWQTFNWQIYQTPHFDIYNYMNNREVLNDFAEHSEEWYAMHRRVLRDTIAFKNPILLYNNHADFQQTNAISGQIGLGTGGVTEGLRNRVVLPLGQTNQQTDHVLGHELVHAFQYDMILRGDTTSMENLRNLPLWMIEGMAEYLSIGRYDPHTAMWMRDAVMHDDIPSIDKLSDPDYFPYRWGQAFWAFLTGTYGDQVIRPFFMATAIYGLNTACDSVLQMSKKQLSEQWEESIRSHFTQFIQGESNNTVGRKLISEENSGEMNISPVVSPNGRYLLFMSEKDVFTLDLYIANARSGEIIGKIASAQRNSHLDNIDFLESAGTWSPDSKKVAFVGLSKGKSKMIIKSAPKGKTVDEFFVDHVPSFSNPAWSPNGQHIVVSGMVNGQTDLFVVNAKTGRSRRLTDDIYAEVQPNWSPDGEHIIYATDERSMNEGRTYGKWTYDIGRLNVETEEKEIVQTFSGANNLNPTYDEEGDIWFLSDRDGYRNLYQRRGSDIYMKTEINTGVSGITAYTPALSIAKNLDRIVYSVYEDGGYDLYGGNSEAFIDEQIDPDIGTNLAGILPVVGKIPRSMVRENFRDRETLSDASPADFQKKRYKPRFQLSYLGGNAGGGVNVGGAFGSRGGLAGGVQMLFDDITGNNQLYTALSLNGEIYDIAGVASYLNRKHRIQWGASISHIPYRTGGSFVSQDTLPGTDDVVVNTLVTDIIRIFEDEFNVFAQYPFSTTLRVEAGLGTAFRYYRYDRYTNYYDQAGFFLGQEREKIEIEDDDFLEGILFKKSFLHNVNAAFVGDNSYFGIASPMSGQRFRVGGSKYFGAYDFQSITADYRRYFFAKPVSFAFRAMHFGRYGEDSDVFYPIFLGQMGLVRGLDIGSNELYQDYNLSYGNLTGSKFMMGNFEIRLPFTGPERLSLIKSGFLFTELAAFIDAGVAFNDYSQIAFSDINPDPQPGGSVDKAFHVSTGLSMRVNLFGAIIVEPYVAWPLNRGGQSTFGLNFIPGW